MKTFKQWISEDKIKEAFIVGTRCGKNKGFNVWGAQSDGCKKPPATESVPPLKKSK